MDLNLLAVLVASVVAMLVGWLWYSPILFGKTWMKLVGMTKKGEEQMKKEGGKAMFLGFLSNLVMAYVLAHMINFALFFFASQNGSVSSISVGVQTALWLWLGFLVTTLFGGFLWEKKPIKLFFLKSGYQLVNIVVMAIILSVWR